METKTKEMLNKTIRGDVDKLPFLELGSEKHAVAVEDIVKLCKVILADDEQTNDAVDKKIRRDIEQSTQRHNVIQSIKDNKDRYIRYGIEAAGIILPLMFYGKWMRDGFEFEREGIITSSVFRELIKRFKPTRK